MTRPPPGAAATLWLLGLLGLICLALAMSHELTPYALILSLGACLATRRLGRPELIVITGASRSRMAQLGGEQLLTWSLRPYLRIRWPNQ